MGSSYNPKIITDGLVLCLDAANPKSYPGSGTTWTDLSGNGNNGTLVNGVGYSANNNGSMVFDGVNDYIDCGTNLNFTTEFSFCMFVSPNSNWVDYAIFLDKTPSYRIQRFGSTNQLEFYDGTNVTYGGIINTNSWNFLSVSIGNGICKLYINAIFSGEGTVKSPLTGSPTYPTYIGRYSAAGALLTGNVGLAQVYNKALSATEINQNFNALRGRYGI